MGMKQNALILSEKHMSDMHSMDYFKKYHILLSMLSKNESRLIKSPVCLSLCPPLIAFELLGRFL
jgi:hypothetical protein